MQAKIIMIIIRRHQGLSQNNKRDNSIATNTANTIVQNIIGS